MDTFAYIPGSEVGDSHPLSRFLPPVPAGIGVTFLERHAAAGEWVLDPFGTAPALVAELAQAGKNVLVAVNNPVSRFLLELTAAPPQVTELRTALTQLADSRKGDERMESHIQSLYLTECSRCQRQVPAEAFVWEKGGEAPTARIYHCPCGESGEYPVAEADRANAARIAATDNLHRARALERVAAPNDPDRSYAVQAIECYLPRAVYAIVTIVNKLDSLNPSLSKEQQRALLALILVACDEANSLWIHPAERHRPKQLSIPPHFLEKNVWLALERAVERWGAHAPIPMSAWEAASGEVETPQKPDAGGGIYVFDGPVRSLVPALKVIQPGSVVTVLPRPSQAFWTLSALWTGWLWGRGTAARFKSVLHRRRYDWNWHSEGLQKALTSISPHLPLNTPFLALLAEPEPSFLTASLAAAADSGFDLEGLALRSRSEAAQVIWRRRAFLREEKEKNEIDLEEVAETLRSYLQARGEPVPYLHLHAAGLFAMAGDHSLHIGDIARYQAPIQEPLSHPDFLHHSNSPNVETGLWGFSRWEVVETLSDRVEIALVQHLQKNPGVSTHELETFINNEFKGLFTPASDLVQNILASYGEESGGAWTLRAEDDPSARRADLDAAMQALSLLAARLGYSTGSEEKPWRTLRWLEAGRTVHTFHLVASAVTGRILRTYPDPSGGHILVLPDGRAGLLTYKLGRDPSLRAIAEGWQVMKFDQLQSLVKLPSLERAEWEKELSGSTLELPEQMKLF